MTRLKIGVCFHVFCSSFFVFTLGVFILLFKEKINLLIYFLIFLSTVAETQDDIDPTGTVNLQFLIPGTSEPISAMVGIVSVFFIP